MVEIDYFNVQDLKVELKKHALRGGGITFFSRLVDLFIQIVASMVLARILLPEEFGLVAIVIAFSGFLVIFTDLGLTDAIIQAKEINHKQISALFWINLIVTGTIVLVVIALSNLISWVYSEPRLTNIIRVSSTYLLLAAFSTQHIALLKRRMLFFKVCINEIIAKLISNVIAIILALYGWSYWSLVLREVVLGVCMSVGAWVICGWYPGLPSFRKDIVHMLKFGINTTSAFILNYFGRNLDKILIGWRYGANQLGYYHRAYNLFVLPTTQSTEALKNVAVSTLSKLRNEPIKYCKYYLKSLSIMSFIGMPIGFFSMVESEDLILLLFGHQWVQTVEIFRILAAGIGVWIIYSTRYWLHASLGRSDRLIKWCLVDFIVSIITIFLGLLLGPKGVAFAYTCSLYILTGFGLKYAGEPINLKFRSIFFATWRSFMAALLAGLFCWYIIYSLDLTWSRISRIIISFLIYTSVYLLIIVFFYKNLQPVKEIWLIIKEISSRSAIKIPQFFHIISKIVNQLHINFFSINK